MARRNDSVRGVKNEGEPAVARARAVAAIALRPDAEAQRAAAVGDALLERCLLTRLFGLGTRRSLWNRRQCLARLAALRDGEEAGEVGRACLRPDLPEVGLAQVV